MIDMTYLIRMIQQRQLIWLSCLITNCLSAPLAMAQETPSTKSTPPAQLHWLQVQENQRAIAVETDLLQAVIPKNHPKHWMTGIEKGSFVDKISGLAEVGDGLMVVDWLMEAGSDADWSDQVIAPDGHGVGRYTWYENASDPESRQYALLAHGSSHRKRMIEYLPANSSLPFHPT